jgi:hypothetical protein
LIHWVENLYLHVVVLHAEVRLSPRCSTIDFSPEWYTGIGTLAFACYFGDREEFVLAMR